MQALVTRPHPKAHEFSEQVCGRDNDVDRPYMLIVAGHPDEAAIIPDHSTNKKAFDEIANFL